MHGGGEQIVQRIAYTDQARDELRRAVRTADLLARRLGVTGYPRELTRVVGHRPDGRAPYLVATRRGTPLSELRGELPLHAGQLGAVIDGIIAVLTQLADLRLVHRDIRPGTLLWDGTSVQLTESGLVVDESDERGRAVGTDPWRSPEQAGGLGKADSRDDVYSAGAVIFHLATGEEASAAADMRARTQLLDSSLHNLLEGVFTDHARQRVSGFALRRRRATQTGRDPGVPAGPPVPPTVPQAEQQARENFRVLRAQQLAHRAARLPRPQPTGVLPPTGPSGPWWRVRPPAVAVLLAAVVALVALLAALTLI